ncbi:Gti1/Pac2 family-domain-containing protein, partial [Chytriomyces cf. hyalinus JEL632]
MHSQKPPLETFHGFIKDSIDAQLLVESCIAHLHNPVLDLPIGMTSFPLRSGTVIVFPEGSQETLRVRWRDGCSWSSSKVNGPFLLYRETEIKSSSNSIPSPVKQTSRDKPAGLFTVTSVRANSQLVQNGFAKRTISILGSNNRKYRVVSYF